MYVTTSPLALRWTMFYLFDSSVNSSIKKLNEDFKQKLRVINSNSPNKRKEQASAQWNDQRDFMTRAAKPAISTSFYLYKNGVIQNQETVR